MQVRVYIMDVAMLACMAVQLGVQFRCSDAIADNFDFITNGSLAVLMLISLVLGYPFAIQHVRETVPRTSWRQGNLRVAALWSTLLFVFGAKVRSDAMEPGKQLFGVPIKLRHVLVDVRKIYGNYARLVANASQGARKAGYRAIGEHLVVSVEDDRRSLRR